MKTRFGNILTALVCALALTALTACSQSAGSSSSAAGQASTPSSAGSSSASSSSASASNASTQSGLVLGSEGFATQASGPYASGTHRVEVTVSGYEPFTIVVDSDAAPVSATAFCTLAESGYYDGLAFYRMVEGFCLQGGTLGDTASGHDSSLDAIVGEFSENGVDNPLADAFAKGVVAMARTQDPNSARSTFFITLGSSASTSAALDGKYAAFGTIDEDGMAIVDAIAASCEGKTEAGSGAIQSDADKPIIESMKVSE